MDQKQQKFNLAIWLTRYHYTLVVIVACVTAIAAFFLVLRPKYEELQQRSVFDTKVLDEHLQANHQYADRLQQLIANYGAISSADREKVTAVLPTGPELPDLFFGLDTLARSSNLQITAVDLSGDVDAGLSQKLASSLATTTVTTKVTPAATATSSQLTKIRSLDPQIKIIDVAVHVTGTNYEVLKAFLANLEHSRRLVDVVSLNFSTDLTTVTVNFRVYYLSS